MKKLALLLALVMIFSCVPAMAEIYTEGLPISDETFSFTMLIDDNGTVEDHAVIYDILEAQTNVHVNLELYPYDVACEKYGIYMSTGDYPDVVAGWILGTKDILDLGMGEGTFLPLEELIAEYCPNITAVLDIPGVRDSMTLPDGHIYSIPYVVGEPEAIFKPYINQKWLKAVGMEMPTTPEELKAVLIAFRDMDANENGDPNDEIPFSGDPVNLSLGMCCGWWGVDANSGNMDYPYFENKDGKLHFSANTEEYRTFLEFFADLYSEGLIDPELFTQDSNAQKAKGNQNLYGVNIGYGPSDWWDGYEKGTPEFEEYGFNDFTALPVLKGCDNPIFHRNSYGVTLFRTQNALTDKCDEEKAIAILRWFDNLYEEENSIQSQSGPLGIAIEKLGDGLYRSLPQDTWTQEEKDKYSWGNIFTQSRNRWYHDAVVLGAGETEKAVSEMDIYDEMYGPYLNDNFKKVWPTNEADVERVSILTTDINTYVKSMIAQFVSGETELNDESWKAYCDQLEAYGLQELIELNARALDMEIYAD